MHVVDCRRFLMRDSVSPSSTSHHVSGGDRHDATPVDSDMSDSARQRRELVYSAIQRRLQSS